MRSQLGPAFTGAEFCYGNVGLDEVIAPENAIRSCSQKHRFNAVIAKHLLERLPLCGIECRSLSMTGTDLDQSLFSTSSRNALLSSILLALELDRLLVNRPARRPGIQPQYWAMKLCCGHRASRAALLQVASVTKETGNVRSSALFSSPSIRSVVQITCSSRPRRQSRRSGRERMSVEVLSSKVGPEEGIADRLLEILRGEQGINIARCSRFSRARHQKYGEE